MLPMRREIRQNAAEACRTETLCNQKVVLFAAPATMDEHQSTHHTARSHEGEPFLEQLFPDDLPTLPQGSMRIRLAYEAGSSVSACQRSEQDTMGGGICEELPMIILQRPARGMRHLVCGQPASQEWRQQAHAGEQDSFSFHRAMMSKIVPGANLVMLQNSRS